MMEVKTILGQLYSEVLHIQIKGMSFEDYSVELYTVHGKLVQVLALTNCLDKDICINTSDLYSGMYLLLVSQHTQIIFKRKLLLN